MLKRAKVWYVVFLGVFYSLLLVGCGSSQVITKCGSYSVSGNVKINFNNFDFSSLRVNDPCILLKPTSSTNIVCEGTLRLNGGFSEEIFNVSIINKQNLDIVFTNCNLLVSPDNDFCDCSVNFIGQTVCWCSEVKSFVFYVEGSSNIDISLKNIYVDFRPTIEADYINGELSNTLVVDIPVNNPSSSVNLRFHNVELSNTTLWFPKYYRYTVFTDTPIPIDELSFENSHIPALHPTYAYDGKTKMGFYIGAKNLFINNSIVNWYSDSLNLGSNSNFHESTFSSVVYGSIFDWLDIFVENNGVIQDSIIGGSKIIFREFKNLNIKNSIFVSPRFLDKLPLCLEATEREVLTGGSAYRQYKIPVTAGYLTLYGENANMSGVFVYPTYIIADQSVCHNYFDPFKWNVEEKNETYNLEISSMCYNFADQFQELSTKSVDVVRGNYDLNSFTKAAAAIAFRMTSNGISFYVNKANVRDITVGPVLGAGLCFPPIESGKTRRIFVSNYTSNQNGFSVKFGYCMTYGDLYADSKSGASIITIEDSYLYGIFSPFYFTCDYIGEDGAVPGECFTLGETYGAHYMVDFYNNIIMLSNATSKFGEYYFTGQREYTIHGGGEWTTPPYNKDDFEEYMDYFRWWPPGDNALDFYPSAYENTLRVGEDVLSGPNIVGGPQIGGNYWTTEDGNGYSDNCVDANGDGFCDEPYVLQVDGKTLWKDFHPLTHSSGKCTPEVDVSLVSMDNCHYKFKVTCLPLEEDVSNVRVLGADSTDCKDSNVCYFWANLSIGEQRNVEVTCEYVNSTCGSVSRTVSVSCAPGSCDTYYTIKNQTPLVCGKEVQFYTHFYPDTETITSVNIGGAKSLTCDSTNHTCTFIMNLTGPSLIPISVDYLNPQCNDITTEVRVDCSQKPVPLKPLFIINASCNVKCDLIYSDAYFLDCSGKYYKPLSRMVCEPTSMLECDFEVLNYYNSTSQSYNITMVIGGQKSTQHGSAGHCTPDTKHLSLTVTDNNGYVYLFHRGSLDWTVSVSIKKPSSLKVKQTVFTPEYPEYVLFAVVALLLVVIYARP